MTVAPTTAAKAPLDERELRLIDAYWRAANYLSVGQIYLLDNPLLREPLLAEHVKPRLLGHWGTTPGLNLLYAHLNRIIRARETDVLFVCGPGHGGPAMVANTWLEGTYTEIYPSITRDARGMGRLFRQFSFPGGIPSHVAPETPGSIHEGGELGYALSHAYGAAFDNPDLIVACVVGDGEAETGPLATGWHGNKFINPARDGCVLPIVHLNGYKIANPCFLARIPKDELQEFFEGMGTNAKGHGIFVETLANGDKVYLNYTFTGTSSGTRHRRTKQAALVAHRTWQNSRAGYRLLDTRWTSMRIGTTLDDYAFPSSIARRFLNSILILSPP